jgi:hypothetical protein
MKAGTPGISDTSKILTLACLRAFKGAIGNNPGKYGEYERAKNALPPLPPDEYEAEIKRIMEKLKI